MRKNIRSIISGNVHKYSTGTDGHRTVGRPWLVSPLKSFSQVAMICWSTRITLPLPHPEMIPSLLPSTIRWWCLCLATLIPDLILAGRSRLQNGVPCSSVSKKENRSVTSHMITACRMRQSVGCCVLHVAEKLGRESTDSTRGQ